MSQPALKQQQHVTTCTQTTTTTCHNLHSNNNMSQPALKQQHVTTCPQTTTTCHNLHSNNMSQLAFKQQHVTTCTQTTTTCHNFFSTLSFSCLYNKNKKVYFDPVCDTNTNKNLMIKEHDILDMCNYKKSYHLT